MAIGNNGIGGPGDRRVGGNNLDRPSGISSATATGIAIPRHPLSRQGRDPYDLRTAFDRLKRLLWLDGTSGPRQGIPDRGFYLNVLV